jgi:hypothetical protein
MVFFWADDLGVLCRARSDNSPPNHQTEGQPPGGSQSESKTISGEDAIVLARRFIRSAARGCDRLHTGGIIDWVRLSIRLGKDRFDLVCSVFQDIVAKLKTQWWQPNHSTAPDAQTARAGEWIRNNYQIENNWQKMLF